MTEEKAIEELKSCIGLEPEGAHSYADSILIDFLRHLGYNDVADAWEEIQPKWYA